MDRDALYEYITAAGIKEDEEGAHEHVLDACLRHAMRMESVLGLLTQQTTPP